MSIKHVFHVPEPGVAGVTCFTAPAPEIEMDAELGYVHAMGYANAYFNPVGYFGWGTWRMRNSGQEAEDGNTYVHFDWRTVSARATKMRLEDEAAALLDKPGYDPGDIVLELIMLIDNHGDDRGVLSQAKTPDYGDLGGHTSFKLNASTGESFTITVERTS